MAGYAIAKIHPTHSTAVSANCALLANLAIQNNLKILRGFRRSPTQMMYLVGNQLLLKRILKISQAAETAVTQKLSMMVMTIGDDDVAVGHGNKDDNDYDDKGCSTIPIVQKMRERGGSTAAQLVSCCIPNDIIIIKKVAYLWSYY